MNSLVATLTFVPYTGTATFDHHEVTLTKDGVDGVPVQTTDDTVTFTDLEPGSYTASAVSMDSTGTAMSAPSVTVSPVVIPVSAPGANIVNSITLALGDSTTTTPPPALGMPTTTTLTADNANPAANAPVVLTAVVSPSVATGTVTFSDGVTSDGTGSLDATGTATLTASFAAGTHIITAAYSGDASNAASESDPLTVTAT